MNFLIALLLLIARICIASIFLLAGANKLLNYNDTVQYMASYGFTMIPFFLFSAATIEILGALALIIGFKTRFAALILILFLIPTTLIFHNFWNFEGGQFVMMRLFFFHNVALIGGLLYILCHGAGKLGCDCCSGCKKPEASHAEKPSQ